MNDYTLKPWAKKTPKWVLRIMAVPIYFVGLSIALVKEYLVPAVWEFLKDMTEIVQHLKIGAFYDKK